MLYNNNMTETIDKETIDEYFKKLFEKLKHLKPLFNILDDLIKNNSINKLVLLAQHPVEVDIAIERIKATQRKQELMGNVSKLGEGLQGMSTAAATTTDTINPLTGKTEFYTKGGAPIEIDKEFE